jgi:hypothetical protein
MDVSFDEAVRTLVHASMGHASKPVEVSLIVAVLAPRFSHLPEQDIARIVNGAVLEGGGTVGCRLAMKSLRRAS